jgi:phenylpropionate dioxygenase-like ring-hydroxylating dioxygenase large terminal subunit
VWGCGYGGLTHPSVWRVARFFRRSVLWRDGGGEWRAYVDKCPHRLAPFSEGRINEAGFLECGYHAYVTPRRRGGA